MSTLNVGTVKATTLQTAAGVEVYTCKAWVNFNGTGTVAIRASGNVSSITDNRIGDYTVNFTNAFADANYEANMSVGSTTTNNIFITSTFGTTAYTTSKIDITCQNGSQSLRDADYVHVSIFR